MRTKFIAGNWKMYTTHATGTALAKAIAEGVIDTKVTVAVCPPFPYLAGVGAVLHNSNVKLGSQNVHDAVEGAYTGETAPGMLKDVGCSYAIIGHSERRHGLAESDAFLNRKVKATFAIGITPIFCIGELLAEREANQTEAVLDHQLTAGLAGISAEFAGKLVIAYEPVWAIGTGKVATPDQAQAAHAFIRSRYSQLFGKDAAATLTIQYGGSVKPDNAKELLHLPDVDGALVGGASLKADSFLAIVNAGR